MHPEVLHHAYGEIDVGFGDDLLLNIHHQSIFHQGGDHQQGRDEL